MNGRLLTQTEVNKLLQTRLGLHISEFTSEQSKFFKNITPTIINPKPMTLEIDMLRIQEGW